MPFSYRKTSQFLMPALKPTVEKGRYDIYPAYNIGEGKIVRDISTIASIIAKEKLVLIDGFSGVFFDLLKTELDSILICKYDIAAQWISTSDFLKPEEEINKMISPFLGGDDPLFGTRTLLSLRDFYDIKTGSFQNMIGSSERTIIIYGTGAGIFCSMGFLIYLDLPKNELQFRARAGKVTNIGACLPSDDKSMYKRFYFVDWIVLGKHKRELLERIDILADCQRADDITWINGNAFREALYDISRNVLRTRPWFEPGAWGGSWIKENIPGVNKEVTNYAWSFELISPENGLIIESSGLMLEFSFDFLMFQEAEAILGDCYERFRTEFPIRFDFLDTINGGNLSIQCHPTPEYIKNHFGEDFTQEESYYILDTKDNAGVYLGLREDIEKEKFRNVLEESAGKARPLNIEEFVQVHPSRKHDLFLIPYGTIHGSGKNNMVLEISSTPYIFTFKMYDWLRPDLDGHHRTLNIGRGIDNLYFDRKGNKVSDELISKPVMLNEGIDWQLFHLPTHPTHLYDVHRYHFMTTLEIETKEKCHVLSLVEGESITLISDSGKTTGFSYGETFVVPASLNNYRIINESENLAILVLAFVK
jgi:mannose-6-phosphate isomerase class I